MLFLKDDLWVVADTARGTGAHTARLHCLCGEYAARSLQLVSHRPTRSKITAGCSGLDPHPILMPTLQRLGGFAFRGLCTAKGMSAEHSARGKDFAFATTEVSDIWKDSGTSAVFIATRHDLHAELVIAALKAGKHVFVEKRLCIRTEELDAIAECIRSLGDACPILTVGFNRRFAPATAQLQRFLAGASPLSISYRFAPGPIPKEHWTQDEEVGGDRIVGEACHAIDTCTALAKSEPVRVFAESADMVGGAETTDDRVFLTVRHRNGCVSSISYQAGGDRGFPSERLEVFGGGRVATVEG